MSLYKVVRDENGDEKYVDLFNHRKNVSPYGGTYGNQNAKLKKKNIAKDQHHTENQHHHKHK